MPQRLTYERPLLDARVSAVLGVAGCGRREGVNERLQRPRDANERQHQREIIMLQRYETEKKLLNWMLEFGESAKRDGNYFRRFS